MTSISRRFFLAFLLVNATLFGCKPDERAPESDLSAPIPPDAPVPTVDLPDGSYRVDFTSDSSMFHENEAYEGKSVMTVESRRATLHLVMPSKNVVNLFLGKAEDARKEGAKLLIPTDERVVYSDGVAESVYAYELPVPVIDADFDVALVGRKGAWYDHRARVSNPVLIETSSRRVALAPGEYSIPVALEGGSGRGGVESPAAVVVAPDGNRVALRWSSPFYDYMIVDGTRYDATVVDKRSVFEFPVPDLSAPLAVVADSVAMSRPHEIEYTLRFDLSNAVPTSDPATSDADQNPAP